MTLSKVERNRMSDQIFRQLKEDILDGSLPPGEALPAELRLCEAFGSSRTAVREAIRQLELLGLVDSRQGARRTVCPRDEMWNLSLLEDLLVRGGRLDAQVLAHILEVRRDFLAIILERAGERGRRENWEELRDMARIQSMETDRAALLRRDLRFVAALARATGNPLYAMILQSFLPSLERILPQILELVPGPEPGESTYEPLVDALEGGRVADVRDWWLRGFEAHDAYLLERLESRDPGA